MVIRCMLRVAKVNKYVRFVDLQVARVCAVVTPELQGGGKEIPWEMLWYTELSSTMENATTV
jgi:hypothetical protein